MKIGIFADAHYSSRTLGCGNRYYSQSLRKIREAMNHFRGENCDLVISMGDLIDVDDTHEMEADNLGKVASLLAEYPVPVYCIMGNHDGFAFTQEDYYRILGEKCRPVDFSAGETHLVFLDACYFASGRHYGPGDTDWTDTFYPFETELKEKLAALQGDVYVFLHQNLDPTVHESHRLANDGKIRQILEESGKVKMVIQGHYHPGNSVICNQIPYRTYPAMCELEGAYGILEV